MSRRILLQRVAVIGPARAAQFAQPVDRPFDLVLGVDHVAPGAQCLGLGDLAARADRFGAVSRARCAADASRHRSPRRPRRPPSARPRIRRAGSRRATPGRPAPARRPRARLPPSAIATGGSEYDTRKPARRPHHRIIGMHLRARRRAGEEIADHHAAVLGHEHIVQYQRLAAGAARGPAPASHRRSRRRRAAPADRRHAACRPSRRERRRGSPIAHNRSRWKTNTAR